MKSKSFYSQVRKAQAISRITALLLITWLLVGSRFAAAASDAPPWMHALVNAPLPAHDEKTDAVRMYVEENVTVISATKIKSVYREAYKILRPGGRDEGTVAVYFNSHRKITSLRGWCIPAQGKDFEVKDKDAVEMAPPYVENGELVTDVRAKVLRIPAPTRETSWGMNMRRKSSRWFCRTAGTSRRRIPHGKVVTHCNCLRAGSTRQHSSTIQK